MKLTESDVVRILEDRRPEAEVARDFGVQQNTINRIRTGARWAHVAPNIPRWRKYVHVGSVEEALKCRIKIDEKTDCWNWQRATYSGGYGRFSFEGKQFETHRTAYELWKEKIPEGMLVRHKCDNPACCNPEHLTVGTDADNSDDKVSRRRHYFGERHHWSKLTVEQINEIRSSSLRNADLARMFGVDPSAVSHIKRNRNWRATP